MSYDPNNIFAKILRGEAPSIKLFEDEHTYAMMDIMPQSEGHALILTKEPAANLFELSPEAAAHCIQSAQRLAKAIGKALAPDGVVVSQFNGAAAGQTVFHVHFHIVPRRAGEALRAHSREMADPAELEKVAARIRAALD
ncbi:HIT family protein [Verticiella sediminum]|uniref:HIT family protein n=1 Tax=Verticiella sediminum TaxID=1247510 RepID=A0A556B249_9BURK|nr:HIT family protein [Verticiella sediminum]TSH99233.1 HIT family protein [Verticiella sediminum]